MWRYGCIWLCLIVINRTLYLFLFPELLWYYQVVPIDTISTSAAEVKKINPCQSEIAKNSKNTVYQNMLRSL